MNLEHRPVAKTTDRAPREELGARLRQIRRHSKLTQTQVATRLKVTKQAISNWEKGKNEPTRRHKQLLADLYGVPVEGISRRYDFILDHPEAQPYRRTDVDRLKLIEARHSLGLTQQEAGAQAGLSVKTVYQYETGVRIPSTNAMLKMAAAYGKPLSWFMKDLD